VFISGVSAKRTSESKRNISEYEKGKQEAFVGGKMGFVGREKEVTKFL